MGYSSRSSWDLYNGCCGAYAKNALSSGYRRTPQPTPAAGKWLTTKDIFYIMDDYLLNKQRPSQGMSELMMGQAEAINDAFTKILKKRGIL